MKVKFFGAFKSATKARTTANRVGGKVKPIRVRNRKRYVVLKRKKG